VLSAGPLTQRSVVVYRKQLGHVLVLLDRFPAKQDGIAIGRELRVAHESDAKKVLGSHAAFGHGSVLPVSLPPAFALLGRSCPVESGTIEHKPNDVHPHFDPFPVWSF
jgi:hypothetical protein